MLKPLARQMRRDPTAAEHALWQRVRRRQICGLKFRRQFAIDRYIVDICCPSRRLVVEIDGPIHRQTHELDDIRQAVIEGLGFRVLRFTNDIVLGDIERVVASIERAVTESTPP